MYIPKAGEALPHHTHVVILKHLNGTEEGCVVRSAVINIVWRKKSTRFDNSRLKTK